MLLTHLEANLNKTFPQENRDYPGILNMPLSLFITEDIFHLSIVLCGCRSVENYQWFWSWYNPLPFINIRLHILCTVWERNWWIHALINKRWIIAACLCVPFDESPLSLTGWASLCVQALAPTRHNLGRSCTVKWSACFTGHVCQHRLARKIAVFSSIPSAKHTKMPASSHTNLE